MVALLPLAAAAQNGTITVGNGTATNNNVPVWGYNCDNYLRCQILYTAADLSAAMAGTNYMPNGSSRASIRQMTFYTSTPANDSWGSAQFQVRIRETSASSLGSSYISMSTSAGGTTDVQKLVVK